MPSAQIQALAAAIRAQVHAAPAGAPPPVPAMRAMMDHASAMIALAKGTVVEEIAAGGVTCEWLSPSEARAGGALLYLHGGGYVIGSRRSHRPMISRMAARSGLRALSVEYRLARRGMRPSRGWPSFCARGRGDDCVGAMAARLGSPPCMTHAR